MSTDTANGDKCMVIGVQAENVQVSGNQVITCSSQTVQLAPLVPLETPIGSVGILPELKNFVGRKVELTKLEIILARSNYAILEGMAGLGKTSICNTFLARSSSDFQQQRFTLLNVMRKLWNRSSPAYANKIWVDAETKTGMTDRFKEIASRLQLRTEEQLKNISEWKRSEIEEIYFHLTKYPTILIFDNADGLTDILNKRDGILHFLPPSVVNGIVPKVIVTTRYTAEWDSICSEEDVIKLDKFSKPECQQFILNRCKKELVKDVAEHWNMLAEYYDYLPIAMESSTGIIRSFAEANLSSSGYTIQNFMAEFATGTSTPLNVPAVHENEAYTRIKRLWTMTLDKLNERYGEAGKRAVHILNALAFLSPDGVPVEFLAEILQKEANHVDYGEFLRDATEPAVKLLVLFSLVKVADNKILVHRLLQSNCMENMTKKRKLDYSIILAKHMDVTFHSPLTAANRKIFGRYIENLIGNEQLLKALEDNPRLLREFDSSFAIKVSNHIFKIRSQALKKDHPSTVDARGIFLGVLLHADMDDEALFLQKSEYKRQVKLLGPDDFRTLCTRDSIAGYYWGLNMHSEGIEFIRKDYARQQQELGPDHPRTISTRTEYVRLLKSCGKKQESLDLLQTDYDRQSRSFGPDDPRTVETRDTLFIEIWMYNQNTTVDPAVEFIRNDMERQLHLYGPDDYRTLATRNYMIFTIWNRWGGSKDHSIHLLNTDYLRQRKPEILGPDDYRTITTRNWLTELWSYRGQYDQAVSLLEAEVHRQAILYGQDDFRTISTRHQLVEIIWLYGDYTKALELLQTEYRRQELRCDTEDSLIVETLTRDLLVRKLVEKRKYDEATKLLAKDLARYRKRPRTDNRLVTETRDTLVSIYRESGKGDDGVKLLTEYLAFHIRKHKLDHPLTIEARAALVTEFFLQNKPEDALQLLQEDYDARQSTESNAPLRVQARNNLVRGFYKSKKYNTALKYLNKDFKSHSTEYGPDDPRTIETRNSLVIQLHWQRKEHHALMILSNYYSRQLQQRDCGSDSVITLETREQIIDAYFNQLQLKTSIRMVREDFQGHLESYGPNHSHTIRSRFKLVEQLWLQEMYMEAVSILIKYYQSLCSQNAGESDDELKLQTLIKMSHFLGLNKRIKYEVNDGVEFFRVYFTQLSIEQNLSLPEKFVHDSMKRVVERSQNASSLLDTYLWETEHKAHTDPSVEEARYNLFNFIRNNQILKL